jgi:carbon storage regulator
MLVLTRRTGEEIVIDGRIHIIVAEVRGERVRLGITAPQDVRVARAEIHERPGPAAAGRPLGATLLGDPPQD